MTTNSALKFFLQTLSKSKNFDFKLFSVVDQVEKVKSLEPEDDDAQSQYIPRVLPSSESGRI